MARVSAGSIPVGLPKAGPTPVVQPEPVAQGTEQQPTKLRGGGSTPPGFAPGFSPRHVAWGIGLAVRTPGFHPGERRFESLMPCFVGVVQSVERPRAVREPPLQWCGDASSLGATEATMLLCMAPWRKWYTRQAQALESART